MRKDVKKTADAKLRGTMNIFKTELDGPRTYSIYLVVYHSNLTVTGVGASVMSVRLTGWLAWR